MKKLRRWMPLLGLVFLCGCFQVEDDLTIQADGSGTVRLTVKSSLPPEMAEFTRMSGGMGRRTGLIYPPINEKEAASFFPAKDFALKCAESSSNEIQTTTIEAAFKDVNALLRSPYAKAHQLALETNAAGRLTFRARNAAAGVVALAQAGANEQMPFMGAMPGMAEARKKKNEMRFEFRVTLPNPIGETTGAKEGVTARWVAARDQAKDDADFAHGISRIMEASCPAQGLGFLPVTLPRLGLDSFDNLKTGVVPGAAPLPDTNKILASAKFVPLSLRVTRSLDLTGEGHGESSLAQLSGIVLIAPELEPQRWGETKLLEAVDAKGNSLAPKEDSDTESRFSRLSSFSSQDEEESDTPEEGATNQAPAIRKHSISLTFKAPEWKVKEIARIQGSVDLLYTGESEVIKISNAVPAGMVMDLSKRASGNFSFDSERGLITDPRLSELGVTMRVQMAMIQGGSTIISLQIGGTKASVLELQVFDADGKPHPTTLNDSNYSGGEERACQIMVAGKPKPPFSFAMVVGGIGSSVTLPISVENVPTADK
jgi:hypothetical protein